MRQVPMNSMPMVGDCPDFRAGFAERKWDCPLLASMLPQVQPGMLFSGTCLKRLTSRFVLFGVAKQPGKKS